MALVSQILEQGPRNLVLKITGTPVDSAVTIVNPTTLNPPCRFVRLDKVQYDLGVGTSVQLLWDATTDDVMLSLSEGPGQTFKFHKTGGLTNPKSAGFTGNVNLTSAGTAPYSLVLQFIKKYN